MYNRHFCGIERNIKKVRLFLKPNLKNDTGALVFMANKNQWNVISYAEMNKFLILHPEHGSFTL